ncbi:hypothetical protein EJB05_49936, partial [Eragrostis curvula]
MWALPVVYSGIAAYQGVVASKLPLYADDLMKHYSHVLIIEDITAVVAALLLGLRPRRIVSLTSTPFGRRLLSVAKVILAVWLAIGLVLIMIPGAMEALTGLNTYLISVPFGMVVLSLGSLQNPEDSLFGRWIDAIMHILFLCLLVFPFFPTFLFTFLEKHTSYYLPLLSVITGLEFLTLLVLLMIGNLQIPAAAVQVFLSFVRFHDLLAHGDDYYPSAKGSNNMVLAVTKVFYVLALCQGSLYIIASIFGVLSFFPRKLLICRSKFYGRRGAKAISLYYRRAYTMYMDSGLIAASKMISLGSFAIESLSSSCSREVQLAAVLLLDGLLLEESGSSQDLMSRIIGSNEALSRLIDKLRWSDVRDRDIRMFAARVTTKLAGSIRIAEIPGMVKSVSSLLDAGNHPARQQDSQLNRVQVTPDSTTVPPRLINGGSVVANQPLVQESSAETTFGTSLNAGSSQPRDGRLEHGESYNNRVCSTVSRWWQRIKERWSIPEDSPMTDQDSFAVLGMVILEKLACDPDNCAEILKAKDLISKIIGLISYAADEESNNYHQQNKVICSSLHLVRRLASIGGKFGVTVRQKLWENPILIDNLAGILEDSRSSPEVRTPTMDIIAKLALDGDARKEIGSTQVIICKLVHAFLCRDEPYDQSLRMAAGEALANLTMESTANCSAILEEPGYELVKSLKDMLCKDECRIYIYVAASLLQNLYAHSRDKLMSHPGSKEHLRSALPAVIENIVSADGKHLESLIGLASQICSIPECFVFELVSQANVAGLVKKLVSTLNSNRKPSPEYPRMRRVTVEMVISLVRSYDSYPGCRNMLIEEGVMEALSEAARTPSKVEKYRVFSGDEGVVVERGIHLRDLADSAKGLIGSALPI